MIGKRGCRTTASRHRSPVHSIDQRRIRTVSVGINRRGFAHQPAPNDRSGRTVPRGCPVLGRRGFLRQTHHVEGAVGTNGHIVVPLISGKSIFQNRTGCRIPQIHPSVQIQKRTSPHPTIRHTLELDPVPPLVIQGRPMMHKGPSPSSLQGHVFHPHPLDQRHGKYLCLEIRTQIHQHRLFQNQTLSLNLLHLMQFADT